MRHYEIVFLVHPDQSEQVPAMIDRYKEMVASGEGQTHRTEDWGRRRLAYSINDVHKAHYVMMNIECSLDVLREIERNFKFNDSILRHLVIRRKVAIAEESQLAKAKAEEDRADAEKKRSSEERSAKADEAKAEKATAAAKVEEVPAAETPKAEDTDKVDTDKVAEEVK